MLLVEYIEHQLCVRAYAPCQEYSPGLACMRVYSPFQQSSLALAPMCAYILCQQPFPQWYALVNLLAKILTRNKLLFQVLYMYIL